MRILFPLNKKNQQRQLEKLVYVYPALLAMYATKLRNDGNDVVWAGNDDGSFDKIIYDDSMIDINFNELPYPDRIFTDAKNKRWQVYGNYRYHPATHSQVANLCWYSRCVFCRDTQRLESGEEPGLRSVGHFLEEIDDLIKNGYRECFDDSGTFPIGKWLDEFCNKMISSGRNKKIVLGANMKPVSNVDYELMGRAGFKFMLFGMESANQETLDIIKKGGRADEYIKIMKRASAAGLAPHTTWMTGYKWETDKDEQKTVDLCNYLLKKGYAKTAQASVYSPPWTEPDPNSPGHKYIPKFYDAYKSPEFLWRKLTDIRCVEDVSYLLRGARLVAEEKLRKFLFQLKNKSSSK